MFVSKYSSCFRTLVVSLKVSTGSLQGLSYRCVLWLCCFTRRASQRVLAWTHFQLPYCRYCCFYVISLFLWRFQDNKNKSWRGNQSVILVWRVSRAFFQNGVTEWLSVITGQLCTVALLRFQTAFPRPPPSVLGAAEVALSCPRCLFSFEEFPSQQYCQRLESCGFPSKTGQTYAGFNNNPWRIDWRSASCLI